MVNYYEVLNVSRTASDKMIKAALKIRMQEVHPDLHGGDHTKAQLVNEAYNVLSDPRRRADHDRKLDEEAMLATQKTEEAGATHPTHPDNASERATVAPPPTADPGRGRGLAWAIIAVILVVVVGAMFFVFAPRQTPTAAGRTSTPIPTTTPIPSPEITLTSDINLTRVANVADLSGIAQTLDTYFAGINAHDDSKILSAFASGALSDTEKTKLLNGSRTSHDDRIQVNSITPATFNGQPGYAVAITFRSQQEASQGGGETCTLWSATERLVKTDSERPRMLLAPAQKIPGGCAS